jgi:hypothetical protein
MKKRLFTLVAVASLAFLTLLGCSNSKIDTAKVRAALQPALDGGQNEQLDLALSDIDAGKYKDAVLPLRKLAFGAKFDKDQSKLLKDTLNKVQIKIAKEQ